MDDFTLAYGLILLVQGIGSLVGPPLAGFIFSITNRWDDSFYLGGICIGKCSFVTFALFIHNDFSSNKRILSLDNWLTSSRD